MKGVLKGVGILMVICAVILYVIAGYVQEQAKPRTVTFGVVSNGTFSETGSGKIGGNSEAVEEMGWLKVIAVMSGIGGVGALIGSVVVKDEQEPQY